MNILKFKRNPGTFRNENGPSKPLIASDYSKEFRDSEPTPDSRYLLDKFGGMSLKTWRARAGNGLYIPAGGALQHTPTHTLGKDSKWSNTDFFTGSAGSNAEATYSNTTTLDHLLYWITTNPRRNFGVAARELRGGAGLPGKVALRRRSNHGGNFDLVAGYNLSSRVDQIRRD